MNAIKPNRLKHAITYAPFILSSLNGIGYQLIVTLSRCLKCVRTRSTFTDPDIFLALCFSTF